MSEDLQQNTTADATAPAQAPAAPQANTNDLTLNDLQALKSIIDVASSRGAFKPGQEMVAVGNVYAKLDAFLQAVAQQAEAAKTANPGA
jgi:hypothetical protein